MIKYPLIFPVEALCESGIEKKWNATASQPNPITLAIPPEFEGPGGGYSPEDLYGLALLNCFAATFKVIAERSRLTYATLRLNGILTVDRNEAGSPWMKHFALKGILTGTSDSERAQRLLSKTSESCLILNSVKTEKTFEFAIEA